MSEGAGAAAGDEGPRYEILFDCRDHGAAEQICDELEELVPATRQVRRTDEGPTWVLTLDFDDRQAADRFFSSDEYQRVCVEVRRACNSSVFVVPLGPRARADEA